MNDRSKMNAIAAAVDKYLSDKGYKYTWDEDKELFEYDVWSSGVTKKVTIIIDIRETNCRSYARLPLGPNTEDSKMMADMCELLTRINYLLVNGNFEMDMDDGEIRYKVYMDCEDIVPSREMIASAIRIPERMAFRFSDAIFDVLSGKKTPAEAMEETKNQSQQLDSRLDAIMAQLMAKAAGDSGDSDTDDSSIDGIILHAADEETAEDETAADELTPDDTGEDEAAAGDNDDSPSAALEAQFQALLQSIED